MNVKPKKTQKYCSRTAATEGKKGCYIQSIQNVAVHVYYSQMCQPLLAYDILQPGFLPLVCGCNPERNSATS